MEEKEKRKVFFHFSKFSFLFLTQFLLFLCTWSHFWYLEPFLGHKHRWGHLETSGGILGTLGDLGGHLGTRGHLGGHSGTLGHLGGHLGTLGHLGGHLGTLGLMCCELMVQQSIFWQRMVPSCSQLFDSAPSVVSRRPGRPRRPLPDYRREGRCRVGRARGRRLPCRAWCRLKPS